MQGEIPSDPHGGHTAAAEASASRTSSRTRSTQDVAKVTGWKDPFTPQWPDALPLPLLPHGVGGGGGGCFSIPHLGFPACAAGAGFLAAPHPAHQRHGGRWAAGRSVVQPAPAAPGAVRQWLIEKEAGSVPCSEEIAAGRLFRGADPHPACGPP